MNDRRSAALALVVLFMTLVCHRSALAQASAAQAPPIATPGPGWFDAPHTPGERVEVLTIDGTWHTARLRIVTSEGLFLAGENPPIRREQVWQVYAGGKPSWGWRGFWIGMASGLVIGVAAHLGQGDCSDPTSVCAREGNFGWGGAAGGGLVTAGLGAIVGRLTKGPGREHVLVYAGPTVPKPPVRARDR